MRHLILTRFIRVHVTEVSCDEVKLWENAAFENAYVEKSWKEKADFTHPKEFKRKQAVEKDSVRQSAIRNLIKLPTGSVAEGTWVKVIYKEELLMSKVVAVSERGCDARCFKMPYSTGYNGTTFESEDNTIFYDTVYAVNNIPVKIFLWKYEPDS